MEKDFSEIKNTSRGTAAPILLVGGNIGEGKETNFIELLKETSPEVVNAIRILPTHFMTEDVIEFSGSSFLDKALAEYGEEANRYAPGRTVVLLPELHLAVPAVMLALANKVNENKNPNLIFVMSCPEPLDLSVSVLGAIKDLRIVQFSSDMKFPVLRNPVLEQSPLHVYGEIALDLAINHQSLEGPVASQGLDSLNKFMSAMENVEGGIFGQEAYDRGMDKSVLKGLTAFAKAFEGSDNLQASAISKSFFDQTVKRYPKPRYFENQNEVKRVEPDSPSLG